jgi:hypothetical protein
MKRLLPIHFFLFLLTSLFALDGFSQALPDPGVDPLGPVDSIVQNHIAKKDAVNGKDSIHLTTSIKPTDQLWNKENSAPAYAHEEEPKQKN